jgi:thiamine biosynthesis lipoprotein
LLHGRRFPALGTRVVIVVRHGDRKLARDAIQAAARQVWAVHAEMTRFEPSPLSDVNAHAHRHPVAVSEGLMALLERAREVTVQSGGRFDVTVGRAAAALREGAPGVPARPGPVPGALELDRPAGRVSLTHPWASLDLGGVAKGEAVDRAVAELRRRGLAHFVVNAGGDLYAAGRPSDDVEGWAVRIRDPGPAGGTAHQVTVTERAVATSGNGGRPPVDGEAGGLHLVDPRTGAPAVELGSATVLAPTAAQADAWATAAYVAGPAGAPSLVSAQPGLAAVLVSSHGHVVTVGTVVAPASLAHPGGGR